MVQADAYYHSLLSNSSYCHHHRLLPRGLGLLSFCYRGHWYHRHLSRTVLTSEFSSRELFQWEDCRFLLHALIWCHCFDWHCSTWGNNTPFVRIICKNHIPKQFIDIHDGVCLEQAKSIYPHEFLGPLYSYSSLPTKGNDSWPCLLFS